MDLEQLKGKKIGVLGLSIEGLSVAKFFDRHGVNFTILEKEPLEELLPEAQDFVKKHSYGFISGPRHLENLHSFEVISRSPGVPLWQKEIQSAKKLGVNITSMTKLFFDLCPGRIIGVTGTKGKGTTATLIYEMLKASGSDVYLGGNIGRPPLDFLDDLKPSSLTVLELSSFQLEDLDKSPHLAVVLMVTQEHLDSQAPRSPNYHQTLTEYLKAKKNIVRFQKKEDMAVVNCDFESSWKIGQTSWGRIYRFSTKRRVEPGAYLDGDYLLVCLEKECHWLCRRGEVFLRGEHNLQNVLAAAASALLLGGNLEKVVTVIKTFRGLEHRLEFVRGLAGVKYYDDSFSTTPETAIAAIRSFTEPEVLILGGSEKDSDYSELGKVISQSGNIRAVLLVGVTAPKIKEAIIKSGGKVKLFEGLASMTEVVKKACLVAQPGDVVLLSPACASYDIFKDYKDRGQQFKDEVVKLGREPV